jgi:proteasome lid subunit RPN8/RPN11
LRSVEIGIGSNADNFNSRTTDSATAICSASKDLCAMLSVSESVYDQLRRHGETAYPGECCDILLGTIEKDTNCVIVAVPVPNASTNPQNHYQIDPIHLIRAEHTARSAGLVIVGFHHSHPDHPAEPSTTDVAEAHWHGCSYLITSVEQGSAFATRSFRLSGDGEEDKRFEREEMHVSP